MSVTLATAWKPRGELHRLKKLLPQLNNVYFSVVVSLPPDVETGVVKILEALPNIQVVLTTKWGYGRYLAVQTALKTPASHIQYADMDRLLRWVERDPEEWLRIVETIQARDCLVIGRTPTAYQTYPRALLETESISNMVASYFLGKTIDVSAGSKGFSRQAAKYVIENSTPGHPFGWDAEWPVLLHRAGFTVDTVLVDGLDWETADHYQDKAADAETQKMRADVYDTDPKNWQRRVEIAMEIVQYGLDAAQRPINRE